MKIISYSIYTLIVCLLVGFTKSMENSVSSKNHNSAKEGIFESISKYKLKGKNKGKVMRNSKKEKKFTGPSENKDEEKKQSSTMTENEVSSSSTEKNVPTGPLLYEGWVSFFIYRAADEKSLLGGKVKESYYRNLKFHEQFKRNANLDVNEKSGNMAKNIPNPYSFFLTIFPDNINISEERIHVDTTVYDTIAASRIAPIEEKNGFKGGIRVLPNKSGEYYCFMLKVTGGDQLNYVICTEKSNNRDQLMATIKHIVVEKQRDNGEINQGSEQKLPNANDFMEQLQGKKDAELEKKMSENAKKNPNQGGKVDGYWIKLQGWSTCSLKCGGGTQSYHRMCVPPKNGGKSCSGEPVLTKPCNTEPCPTVKENKKLSKEDQEIAKPIIKVMPFSNRYQRYTKCIIKESDAMYKNEDIDDKNGEQNENSSKGVWMPIRIVMNNRTLTVLEGTNYKKQLYSFNLKSSRFFENIEDPNCWGVMEEKPSRLDQPKKMIFCPFGIKTSAKDWVSEWDYDFNLFKYQCSTPKDYKTFEDDMDDDKNGINDKLNQMKADLIKEKEDQIRKKTEEEEINSYEEKINNMELEAIRKEFNLEELIEKDEAEREKEEEEKIRIEIDKEKEKRECLLKSIKEKERENQYNLMKNIAAEELNDEKDQAKQDIIKKRSLLNSKIQEMRRKSERKLRKLRQELKGVKNRIMDDANEANYSGNYDCSKNDHRHLYCRAKFTIDPVKYGECLRSTQSNETWCKLCCQSENGSIHADKREECEKKCINDQDKVKVEIAARKWFASVSIGDENFDSEGTIVKEKSQVKPEDLIKEKVVDIAKRESKSQDYPV